jgi:hypothetical protein
MTTRLMVPARDAGIEAYRTPPLLGRRRAMLAGSVALMMGALSTPGLKAQDERGNLVESPRPAQPTLQRAAMGTLLRTPGPPTAGADQPPPRVRCQFVCSAVTPRTPIAQVIVDAPGLRDDVAGASQR